MCVICTEIVLGKLTYREAERNLSEMVDQIPFDHLEALEKVLEEYATEPFEQE